MPISFYTASSVQGIGITRLTIPAFLTSGKYRLAVVTAGMSDPTAITVSSVTRAGGSEVFTEEWSVTQGAFLSAGWWYADPSKELSAAVVTFSGNADECCAGVVCLYGADPSTITSATASGNDTSSRIDASRPHPSYWTVDGVYLWDTPISASADMTSRWEEEGIAAAIAGGSSAQEGPAGNELVWTWTATADWVTGVLIVGPMRRWLLN